jgi:hypothetical protein
MKLYRVCGQNRVFGNEPGSEFKRDLTPKHEAFLIKAGHIQVVNVAPPPAAPTFSTPTQEENHTDG